jgi:hypothetical protein
MAFLCVFCKKSCISLRGLQAHIKLHRSLHGKQDSNSFKFIFHDDLNGMFPQAQHFFNCLLLNALLAVPCTEDGTPIAPNTPPPPRTPADATSSNPWSPFNSRLSFEFANYHFTELQSSERQINQALDLWRAAVIQAHGDIANIPWDSAAQMYDTIDSIQEGSIPWNTIKFRYTGPLPAGTPPKWMTEDYELCFRDPRAILLNQIASPELQDHFNYVPYKQFDSHRERVWSNLMSGEWAWNEAV